MNEENRSNRLTILYGSQTGNAQDVAERIWRESIQRSFKSVIKACDEYDILDLVNEACVVFVCSTTGQGEEPENMKIFWKFLLRKNLPLDSLCNVRYAVLGLGDSSYVKFNFVAKRLYKRLQQLGAKAVIPLGLCDDQHDLGYDGAGDTWIESLWVKLLQIFPTSSNSEIVYGTTTIFSRWNVHTKILNKAENSVSSIYYSTRTSTDFDVIVEENKRITDSSHFQDVRLLRLKTNGEKYCPGDVVVLRPRNLKWQINELQDILNDNNVNIAPNTIFHLTENDLGFSVPDVLKYEVTFTQLCEEYFDLMAVPRRYTFNVLGHLTDCELEREKCLEFMSAEGQTELYNYCNRPKRNIVEVLRDFPNATKNLTKESLFELFSPIKAREFSIASSCVAHPNEIHVLLAVVKYKTKLHKERFGLCSNYLADLTPGSYLTAWIKKGSFRFPTQDSVPIIMVGPGTGLAPFRNYIQETVKNGRASSDDLLLFFGCRSRNKDFYLEDELLELQKQDKLHIVCAFSRDQEMKVYVQDKILELKEKVWKILERNGYVFVAGNAKSMPKDVRNAFIQVCIESGKMSQIEAEQHVANMEKTNRYQTECWS